MANKKLTAVSSIIVALLILTGCQQSIFGDTCLQYQTLSHENYRPIPEQSNDQSSNRSVDESPLPVLVVEPKYPRKAAMCGVEGWARFEFTIKTDGFIKNLKLLDSSPDDTFVSEARRALYKWRFKPTTNDNNEPIESQAFYTLEFKLADNK